ncbi:unnamed protein product [Ascophyllum nodosum]
MILVWVVSVACALFAWRLWLVLPYRRRCAMGERGAGLQAKDSSGGGNIDSTTCTSTASHTGSPYGPVKTLVVLGSGGHTSEMLKLTSHLSPETYAPLYYVVASTDHTSAQRIPPEGILSGRCKVRKIPRSREVGQSYLTSVYTTLVAGLHAALMVVKIRPDLVLVNGPGTCIPICVAAFALRVFGLGPRSRTIFCESFCRVKSLSLSGRIMYLLADRFVVHWPELLRKYPRAEYLGQMM